MSWKTTVAGVAAIISTIGLALKAIFDGDPSTVVNWNVFVTSLVSGIGLIMARDNNKSSEDVGVK